MKTSEFSNRCLVFDIKKLEAGSSKLEVATGMMAFA